jgi:hypothetical protein
VSGTDCTDLSHCECVDWLYERISELETALLDLIDHVRQGPRIEYWLYDQGPIGRGLRVLGGTDVGICKQAG